MLHTGGHILKNLRVSIFNSTRFFVAVVHYQYSHRRKNDGRTEMIKRNDGISKDDICQNQFTAYVVLAVKRKRQSCIGIIIPAYRYNKVIPLHKSARYNIIGVNNYAG